MHQLQLIGIKTNLESFVTTTLMEHMLNRHQLHLFLWVSKQWGFTNNTGRPYITFPFKFSNVFTAISCICHNGSPSEANTVYNVSISGMNIGASGGGSGKYWCAFGVAQQQWGFTVFDPVDYKNVNFTLPLSVNGTFCAFSTGYDPKGSTFLWHSMSHFNNVNVGVTGFVFDSRYTFTGLGYLAVCWQKQWGYSNSTGVTFPIAFKECYAVVSNAHSNTTGNTDHYHLLSWTSTGAAFGYWNMSFYGTLYIALGVE